MEKQIGDNVVDRVKERMAKVQVRLELDYKNKKPFRQPEKDYEMDIYIFDNMTREDEMYAIQQYGQEAFNKWRLETWNAKKRRGIEK